MIFYTSPVLGHCVYVIGVLFKISKHPRPFYKGVFPPLGGGKSFRPQQKENAMVRFTSRTVFLQPAGNALQHTGVNMAISVDVMFSFYCIGGTRYPSLTAPGFP